MNDHDCGIDCKPVPSLTGGVAHMMYPSDPTPHAGRYMHTAMQGMTRSEYRATGMGQTRRNRVWDAMRVASPRKRVARNVPA